MQGSSGLERHGLGVADASQLEAALRRLPGVKHVSTKPTEKDTKKRKANNFGVNYRVEQPGGTFLLHRSACTEPDAKNPRPTLADALREAIRSACTELGLDTPVIIAPPAAVPAETEATQAELEWLAEWCDSHEAPQTITTEAAHAELLARACAMDEAGRSLVVGGSSGLMKLQQTQLLLAQVCAAERRVERADASLLLWRSEPPHLVGSRVMRSPVSGTAGSATSGVAYSRGTRARGFAPTPNFASSVFNVCVVNVFNMY